MDKSTVQCVGERLSFSELFNRLKLKVEIPIIQRDYAQGRKSSSEVRKEFLEALFCYLEENRPNRDLDFVYGTIKQVDDGNCFIPLDGQQRLTTLFLLHWYLATLSNNGDALRSLLMESGKSRFTYETRFSSGEFCDALMAFRINFDDLLEADRDKANSLSKTIRDQSWFYLSWENDPTIVAMLTMLDEIHQHFSEYGHFYERLVDPENPIITFLFLDLEKFNLTDDLYIKMNARGKPLTDFENFKAKLEQQIRKFRTQLPQYQLKFKDAVREVDGYEYFIHKIDTDWADLFWEYRNTGSVDDNFDDELMHLIRLVLANFYMLSTTTNNDDQALRLFGDGGRLVPVSFAEYTNIEVFTKDCVVYLIELFDLLSGEHPMPDGKVKTYLDSEDLYSERHVFEKVISNGSSYPEKLRFYALYTYLMKREEGVGEWMRVIYNLTENRVYNTLSDYKNSLAAIDDLIAQNGSVLELLRREYRIKSFSESQVLEERIKAHLLTKTNKWEERIYSAEKHPFFRGQLGFILSFSGIADYYQQNGHCDWSAEEDECMFATFCKYADDAIAVFSLIGKSSAVIEFLWERAVFCKGDYTITATASRHNLLCTRQVTGNIERDYSWKRLFRLAMDVDGSWAIKQSYVKAVFDDPHFNAEDVEIGLREICEATLSNEGLDAWRKKLIKYPSLFSLCTQGFIAREQGSFYLFHHSQRNHRHSELFTRVLELKLKDADLGPFGNMVYSPSRNSEDAPLLRVDQWGISDRSYAISIRFVGGQYEISFKDENGCDDLEDVTAVLIQNGFEQNNQNEASRILLCDSEDATLKALKSIFEELKKVAR